MDRTTVEGTLGQHKRVFVREATGLVRDFGSAEALYLTVGSVIGFGWISLYVGMWGTFPGVNIPLSFVLISLLAAVQVGYYVLIAILMPRTGGGSYVPLSRTIHPILGLRAGFALVFAVILNCGYAASVIASVGISGPIAVYGTISNNAGLQSIGQLIGSTGAVFAIGTALIIIVTIVSLLGNRIVKPFLWITFILATLGYVSIMAVLLITPQGQFKAAFDNFVGTGAYSNVVDVARKAGWNTSSPWAMPTLLSLPFSFFLLAGYFCQTYFAGEVRRVSRTIAVAAWGSIVYFIVIFGGLAFLMQRSFGGDFMTSISYLYTSQPSLYTLSVPPYVTAFVAIANTSPLVTAMVVLGMIGIGLLSAFVFLFLGSRFILAFAFDRAVPSAFGAVNDRLHTPVVALTFIGVLSWIAFVFYTYASPFIGAVNLTFVFTFAFLFDGLAGIALVWRRRDIFDAAPPIVKKKIGGIPVITILGAYSVIFVGALLVLCIVNPIYGGPFGVVTAGSVVGAFVLAAVCYVTMKKYLARGGLDIVFVFKEIPPE